MEYFNKFPLIERQFSPTMIKLVIDITRRVVLTDNTINNINCYIDYIAKDGDTLQSISNIAYGSTTNFWVIMLINKTLNPHMVLPLADNILLQQVINKYGQEHINDIHHYEDENGVQINYHNQDGTILVDENVVNRGYIPKSKIPVVQTPVTIIEYYRQQNELKRVVKLLKPEYLQTILTAFDRLVSQ